MKVAVAMSGGVDSSVAAYILQKQGYEVLGFSMRLHASRPDASSGCCSPADFRDARLVASKLDIPYYVLNFEEAFKTAVIDPFVADYTRGRTPSPCVDCNTHVKFRHFYDRARAAGAEMVATGHYARRTGDGPFQLRRGLDPAKDQSYFLSGIRQEELAHSLFPVGDLAKTEVRALASEAGIVTANKPDSQEICFVENRNYAAFVDDAAATVPTPGPVVDRAGKQLGEHAGIHHYTVGQRRGLGISAPRPLYVIQIDPADNRITVGDETDLATTTFEVNRVSWVEGEVPEAQFSCLVQVRSRHVPVRASVERTCPDRLRVSLLEPVRAVAAGQSAVFYREDQVLGGGTIDAVVTNH